MRPIFRLLQKDKHAKKLSRYFWQGVRVDVEGIAFELYPNDNTTDKRMYLQRRLDERCSLEALAETVSACRCLIFDIGANSGLYSLFLSRAAGQGSEIHAFEPNPVMARRLQRNLDINPLPAPVQVHPCALSSSRGEADLNLHQRNFGQSSLRQIDRSDHTVKVPLMPLTAFYTGHADFDRFIIKIDVEGHEDDVLYAFIASCQDHHLPDAVLLEIVLEQSWKNDLRALFVRRGYRIGFEGEGNILLLLERNR